MAILTGEELQQQYASGGPGTSSGQKLYQSQYQVSALSSIEDEIRKLRAHVTEEIKQLREQLSNREDELLNLERESAEIGR